jgi:hypothetical protein
MTPTPPPPADAVRDDGDAALIAETRQNAKWFKTRTEAWATVDTELSADLFTRLADRLAALTRPTAPSDEAARIDAEVLRRIDHKLARYGHAVAAEPHWYAQVSIADLRALRRASTTAGGEMPIPMVLHCPKCGLQHIDEPEPSKTANHYTDYLAGISPGWDNPPHRSHLCAGCGHIWRPADVATTGVTAIQTRGKADSPLVTTAGGARTYDAPRSLQPTVDLEAMFAPTSPARNDGAGRATLAELRTDAKTALMALCEAEDENDSQYDAVAEPGNEGRRLAAQALGRAHRAFGELTGKSSDELREAAGALTPEFRRKIAGIIEPRSLRKMARSDTVKHALLRADWIIEEVRRAMAGKEGEKLNAPPSTHTDGGWRDMASAPRDGTPILATNAGYVYTLQRCGVYFWDFGDEPGWAHQSDDDDVARATWLTHWQPLPPPPRRG